MTMTANRHLIIRLKRTTDSGLSNNSTEDSQVIIAYAMSAPLFSKSKKKLAKKSSVTPKRKNDLVKSPIQELEFDTPGKSEGRAFKLELRI